MLIDDRLLQGIGPAGVGQSFDSDEMVAIDLSDSEQTAIDASIDELPGRIRSAGEEGAGTAIAFVANDLGSGQTEIVPQPFGERS
jgi:hypothetical protein